MRVYWCVRYRVKISHWSFQAMRWLLTAKIFSKYSNLFKFENMLYLAQTSVFTIWLYESLMFISFPRPFLLWNAMLSCSTMHCLNKNVNQLRKIMLGEFPCSPKTFSYSVIGVGWILHKWNSKSFQRVVTMRHSKVRWNLFCGICKQRGHFCCTACHLLYE